MADLTSKEWRDLIFEGKNTEFGAYEMRRSSTGRYNKAFLIVLAVLALCLGLLILQINGFIFADEEDVLAPVEADEAVFAEAPQEEEAEEEEIEYIEPEEEIPEVEELVEQTMNTEQIDIVEVVDKTKELKTDNELKEATNIGNANVSEGNEDYTEQNQVLQEVKVVEEPKPVEKPKPVEAKVFDAVEQMPTYPGGDKALAKYLSSNLSYPEEATADGASGKVIVQFVVNEDGSVTDVKVARGKHPALDREAVRVVKRMPKWNPGKQNGHSVKVRYTLPVDFRLQNQ